MINKKKKKWNNYYIKWIIHNNILFYSYLIFGVGLVLLLLCNTNVEIMRKIPCRYDSKVLIIKEQKDLILKKNQTAYFYINKNEKVHKITMKEYKHKDNMIYISFSQNDLYKATNGFLEVTAKEENLLSALLR